MIVEEITESGNLRQRTAEFATRHKLLFHTDKWLDCYREFDIRHCAILNNNHDVIGCFLYFRFKKYGYTFVIPPPFTPDTALFFENPATSTVGRNSFIKDVLESVCGYFLSLRASYYSLPLPAVIYDVQPFIWNGFNGRTRYTYLLDLSPSEEALKQGLSSEKRKSLNKASRDGLRVKKSSRADLVYGLVVKSLARNRQDKNLSIVKNIIHSFIESDVAVAYVAYQDDAPMAASFCLLNKDTALYLFGGYEDQNKHHGAGVSCMWACILEARTRGYRFFDFEGSMNKNIERYFREFGAELVPYQCIGKVRADLRLLMKLKGEHV